MRSNSPISSEQPAGRRLFAVGALLLLTRLATAADFSGDVDGVELYSSDGKVRIEASNGYFLISNGIAWFVHPAQRFYTDARQSTPLTLLFIPVDPENPCPQWQAVAMNAGVSGAEGAWRCERVAASHWRVTPPVGSPRECWIDADLKFPVQVRMSDGTRFSLRNIQVTEQPAELFAIPRTYRKLDPHALLERIKHSDVWAAPPE